MYTPVYKWSMISYLTNLIEPPVLASHSFSVCVTVIDELLRYLMRGYRDSFSFRIYIYIYETTVRSIDGSTYASVIVLKYMITLLLYCIVLYPRSLAYHVYPYATVLCRVGETSHSTFGQPTDNCKCSCPNVG
jgi:hypothetical protein